MNVDLFDRTTVSYEVADDLFGIQDEHPAIVTTEGDAKEWNAVVRNSSGDKITFVPLDHQIVIKPTPSTTYSLCDCMLYRITAASKLSLCDSMHVRHRSRS